ncbi:MAG: hypothetical protein IAE99_11785 [Rhodothermales bacterium]|nr:hypothetical protein [Rhodothermales bacterium]
MKTSDLSTLPAYLLRHEHRFVLELFRRGYFPFIPYPALELAALTLPDGSLRGALAYTTGDGEDFQSSAHAIPCDRWSKSPGGAYLLVGRTPVAALIPLLGVKTRLEVPERLPAADHNRLAGAVRGVALAAITQPESEYARFAKAARYAALETA